MQSNQSRDRTLPSEVAIALPKPKTMEHREVRIPAPKFDLYELVTIEINDKSIKTKVTKRFFDPDTKRWSYEISSIRPVVDESALYPRDPA